MSFDARSLERLQALGRQLPQPLPRPEPPAAASRPQPKLHPIERESDPDQLFRELMQASADGTVPPHLLDRLRELEQARAARPARLPSASGSEALAPPQPSADRRRSGGPGRSSRGARPTALTADERSLYDAFDDLLHLQEDDGPAVDPGSDRQRRPPQIELQPKPTQRRAQEGR